MKPHPRIRKTIKWGGVGAAVLLVGMWIGTIWCRPYHKSDKLTLEVREGCFCLDRYPNLSGIEDEPSWGVQSLAERLFCRRPSVRILNSEIWHVHLPLWMPAAFTVLLTGFAWRLETLARHCERLNLCTKCNYDRAGIAADAKCPECGVFAANPEAQ